ncbi:hypothetical protein [Streptomyces sp. JJ38]|uniref:hypothetical protein n=1 Tax=Streptomyces sp. JJ38 TaxID=2738128 RepID=UPI001C591656|nr:hypothetical protein [Streptomyces sp. JJ38]MBW1596815.1 hypothetical protein [Streptomyces sp. JJ38]
MKSRRREVSLAVMAALILSGSAACSDAAGEPGGKAAASPEASAPTGKESQQAVTGGYGGPEEETPEPVVVTRDDLVGYWVISDIFSPDDSALELSESGAAELTSKHLDRTCEGTFEGDTAADFSPGTLELTCTAHDGSGESEPLTLTYRLVGSTLLVYWEELGEQSYLPFDVAFERFS